MLTSAAAPRARPAASWPALEPTHPAEVVLAEPTLAQLFGRVQRDEDLAFHELHARTRQPLYRAVYRVLRSHDLSHDVVQDAYAHIWVQRHQFRPDQGSVLGWMTTIARRRAIDRVRSTDRACRLETHYAATDSTSGDLQTLVVDKLYSSTVTSPALLALTAKQQEALRLTYWDGRTATEAAALLGIPVPTLKSRIHGAITRLRELLDHQLA